MAFSFQHDYLINKAFSMPVAYFSMEYAIHQSLKIYAGGLGFLSGSHMRSAYELGQNMVGIGILWKYGYYNQGRKEDQAMEVLFQEKRYKFLVPTDIKFTVRISQHEVWVTAYYLPPSIFHTAPVFLLTTDLPENDHLARTTVHRLYNSNPESRAAAAILLGEGGAKLLELLGFEASVYHLNESHALPLLFYLYNKYRSLTEVKKRLVFTNHTSEASGNQHTDIFMLHKIGFWGNLGIESVRELTHTTGDILDQTQSALLFSGKANAVSKMHLCTLQELWKNNPMVSPITSITNAQNERFWSDTEMYASLALNDDSSLIRRKKKCKELLFEEVSDQCGVLFHPDVLTIVFAKRFAGYKRPELLLHDMDRLYRLVSSTEKPVQIIWAGKPHPSDYEGIASFDRIVNLCKTYPNCAILVGYELKLSRLLKQGADVWLNNPRLGHEASGTSGMSAAMNGCINLSTPDGWFPEFARNGINSFVITSSANEEHPHQQDEMDALNLYSLLEKTVIPMYYEQPVQWLSVMKASMRDVIPQFSSNRMAAEYYQKLYTQSAAGLVT